MTTAPARSHAAYLSQPAPDSSWAASAACRRHPDPDLWFSDADTKSGKRATAICSGCPVRVPCLAYALSVPGLDGIWAATTPNKRTRLRNQTPKPLPPRSRAA